MTLPQAASLCAPIKECISFRLSFCWSTRFFAILSGEIRVLLLLSLQVRSNLLKLDIPHPRNDHILGIYRLYLGYSGNWCWFFWKMTICQVFSVVPWVPRVVEYDRYKYLPIISADIAADRPICICRYKFALSANLQICPLSADRDHIGRYELLSADIHFIC